MQETPVEQRQPDGQLYHRRHTYNVFAEFTQQIHVLHREPRKHQNLFKEERNQYIYIAIQLKYYYKFLNDREFPDGTAVKTLHSNCQSPGSGN